MSLAANSTRLRSHKMFAGRYILLRELGRGGMGVVYAAFDTEAMRRVALKRIEPVPGRTSEMLAQRFRREIRALAASRHPGTPTLLHCEAAFYTMEIVDGERLSDLLRRGRLDAVRALNLAIELGQILASMHDVGVVHRDVKPSNILIASGDRVRLIDFGACAFLPHFFMRDDLEPEPLTATGRRWVTGDFEVVCTPGYSAPEMVGVESDASVRNDIFSVCAIAYEMITGRGLLDRQSAAFRPIVREEFAPELAPLAEVLARGAAQEPFDRQKSMAELVQGLEVARTQLLAAPSAAPSRLQALLQAATLAATACGVLLLAARSLTHTTADTTLTALPPATPGDAPPEAATPDPPPPPEAASPDPPPPPEAASPDPPRSPPSPRWVVAQRKKLLTDRTPAVQGCVDEAGGVLHELPVVLTLAASRVARAALDNGDSPLLQRCVDLSLRGLWLPGAARDRFRHVFKLRPPHRGPR